MSVITKITTEGDGGQARLAKVVQELGDQGRERIHAQMGRAVRDLVKEHLTEYDAGHRNPLDGQRTHWFQDAAMATASYADADAATVTVTQLGIRLSYYGGTVTPGKHPSSHSGKPTQFLTIPACAEAYGRRASKFPRLQFAVLGGKPALVEAEATELKVKRTKGAKTLVPKHTAFGAAGSTGGRVMFWLARSVTVGPHPDLLPPEHEIRQAAVSAAWDMVQHVAGSEAVT